MRKKPGHSDRGAAYFSHCFFGRIRGGLCSWGGEEEEEGARAILFCFAAEGASGALQLPHAKWAAASAALFINILLPSRGQRTGGQGAGREGRQG